MKKTITILVCLTLVIACLVPACAFAEGTTATAAERDSVHFINPTAITVVGDYLYVADKIEDNKTALLCFEIGDNSSVNLVSTYEMDGVINALSNDGDSTIYAVMGKSVAEIALDSGAASLTDVVYDGFENNVVGFVKSKYGQADTLFALTNNLLRRNNTTGEFGKATNDNWSDTKGCLALNDVVFFVYKSAANNGYFCGGYNSEGYLLSNPLSITEPIGIVEYDGKVAFFSQHSISYVNDISMGYWTSNQEFQGNALETLLSDTGDKTIADVAIKNSSDGEAVIFVLNEGINKIDVYTKQTNAYEVTDTIGSDMVDKTVPTTYTSFTLARPNGYPANIVFKTNDEQSSIDKIYTEVSEYNEYIILGYDGDENSHYYYVMIGSKFGWVKKSSGSATTPSSDSKLTIVDNTYGNGTIGYETKFTSLNSVYIYDLPLSTAHQTEVTQTASTMKTVTVLQKFMEGDQTWYYVSYDEGKTGFVKESDVGRFHLIAKEEITHTLGSRKINSSLFSAVDLYATAELADGETVVNKEGNPIKLYSGDRVTLIEVQGDSAFILIQHSSDHNLDDYGWIDAGRLIGIHQMTTNAIVGLSLLGFAIVLGAILVVVYFKRQKRIKANRD